MDEDRLIDIETKLAYQEKAIRDLNEVICEQQDEIERLKVICKKLTKFSSEYAQMMSGTDAPANEKPPHY